MKLVELVSIPVDSNTSIDNNLLKLYEENDFEYLVIQNQFSNSIQYYSLDNGKLVNEIFIEREGPKGLELHGFVIPNKDSIIVFEKFTSKGFIINPQGDFIDYLYLNGSMGGLNHASMNRTPDLLIGDKISLFVFPGLNYNDSRLFNGYYTFEFQYDIKNQTYRYLPISWPEIYQDNIWGFYHTYPSRVKGKGNTIVYSFGIDHNIYVLHENGSITMHEARGDLIEERINPLANSPTNNRDEVFAYLNRGAYMCIIYDKFRDVYYRIAGHQTEYNNNLGVTENVYRKPYSVIILNSSFEKIGETRLEPVENFSVKDFFVGKKGLYIQSSNYNNSELNENEMKFNLFELIKVN